MFRLDPLRLPVSFRGPDPAADGGSREIVVSRSGVEVKRVVRGMHMRVQLLFSEFKGVAVRVLAPGGGEPVIFLALEHEDDALSILLQASEDSEACAIDARKWTRITGRPILIAGPDGRLQNPASMRKRTVTHLRRKRRSALRNRRSSVRCRSQRAANPILRATYEGEREIIARN